MRAAYWAWQFSTCALTHWGRDKWPQFCRWHFQMHFPKYSSMGSDNGLAPTSHYPNQWWLDYWHIWVNTLRLEQNGWHFVNNILNTLRPRQNGRHFADDIFNCIFLNENVWIPIKISLKFVPRGSINNIPALVQIKAWRRAGDKPLSEPMMVRSLTHICVTRPQWVKCIFLEENSVFWFKFYRNVFLWTSIGWGNGSMPNR